MINYPLVNLLIPRYLTQGDKAMKHRLRYTNAAQAGNGHGGGGEDEVGVFGGPTVVGRRAAGGHGDLVGRWVEVYIRQRHVVVTCTFAEVFPAPAVHLAIEKDSPAEYPILRPVSNHVSTP
jgi:hypothetical protein